MIGCHDGSAGACPAVGVLAALVQSGTTRSRAGASAGGVIPMQKDQHGCRGCWHILRAIDLRPNLCCLIGQDGRVHSCGQSVLGVDGRKGTCECRIWCDVRNQCRPWGEWWWWRIVGGPAHAGQRGHGARLERLSACLVGQQPCSQQDQNKTHDPMTNRSSGKSGSQFYL